MAFEDNAIRGGFQEDMFRSSARPIAFLICTTTLCILAVVESAGVGNAPSWAIGILGTIAGEWLIERGVRKSKGNG